jgi:hypothetical protein
VRQIKIINRAWKNIKGNTKISAKEAVGPYGRKHHKPRFDAERSEFLGQRKQAKIQWLQDPNQSNLDNLKNARRDASKHFSNKKRNI